MLDLTSSLKFVVCIQASGSMLHPNFTGDPKLCRAGASVGIAHGIQQFCKNTDIWVCRNESYDVDEEKRDKGKKPKSGENKVKEEDRDLYSRVTRVKVCWGFYCFVGFLVFWSFFSLLFQVLFLDLFPVSLSKNMMANIFRQLVSWSTIEC